MSNLLQNLTLSDIAISLTLTLTLITSIKSFVKEIKSPIDNKLKEALKPVKDEILSLKKDFNKHELVSVKRDLVNLMGEAEQERITEEQKKMAHELFDIYTEAGLNSYVHAKWEKLEKEGKI